MKKLFLTLFICGLIFILKSENTKAQTECAYTPPTNKGKVTLTTTTTAGTYRVWSRMKAANATNNSFFLQIDSNCPVLVESSSTSWIWVANHINVSLTEGNHIITIIGNESGVGVDKLLMTKNLTCIPNNINGSNCPAEIVTTPTVGSQNATTPIITNNPTSKAIGKTTVLRFSSVKLHGIGNSGDNSNPKLSGNKNPLATTRNLSVELIGEDPLITFPQETKKIIFDSKNGDFQGDITLDSDIPSGNYIIKIKSPQYLKKQLIGIISINQGSINSMPSVTLTTGDINNDNTINNKDNDILNGCYSDLLPAKNCDTAKKAAADLTSDGNVNADDLNLLLREMSNVSGE